MAIERTTRELAKAGLAHAKGRGIAKHVEVRFVDQESESLLVRDRRVDELSKSSSRGFGIRVLANGGWGFACCRGENEGELAKAIDLATAIAVAAGKIAGKAVVFPEAAAQRGTYRTRTIEDPFAVPLSRKMADLMAPQDTLAKHRNIASVETYMSWTRVSKLLVTSEGTDVEQHLVYGGAGMSCVARGDDGRAQRRTYPGPRGFELGQHGYEAVAKLELLEHADALRDEAVALLTAPACPSGVRELLVESSQLALQVHESCGHPTELDRALGSEISLAGGSFLQPSMLGSFRYGAPIVNLTCDSTTEGGMGTFGWDDEGTPAGKAHLVEAGIFREYLSSRETAAALGRTSTGAMRAEAWNRLPIIRMLNVSLEPGKGTLDELIADTKDGVLVATNKSWSIDDMRKNFQFGCEIAWEIKNGKRGRILRDPVYTGRTPEFWRSCNAICGPQEYRLWGIATCGKGDPIQIMQVGHGAAPARFSAVEIGSA